MARTTKKRTTKRRPAKRRTRKAADGTTKTPKSKAAESNEPRPSFRDRLLRIELDNHPEYAVVDLERDRLLDDEEAEYLGEYWLEECGEDEPAPTLAELLAADAVVVSAECSDPKWGPIECLLVRHPETGLEFNQMHVGDEVSPGGVSAGKGEILSAARTAVAVYTGQAEERDGGLRWRVDVDKTASIPDDGKSMEDPEFTDDESDRFVRCTACRSKYLQLLRRIDPLTAKFACDDCGKRFEARFPALETAEVDP